MIDVIILDFGAIYIISEIVKRYETGSLEFLGLIKFKLSKFRYIGFYFFAWPAIIIWSQIIEYLNLDFFQNSNYSEEIFIYLDMEIHPAVAVFSTLFGAYTIGAFGAILALPVAATIQGVLGTIIENRQFSRLDWTWRQ